CHRAAIVPESVGVVKRHWPAGRKPRTPWRAGGSGQTTARAGGPASDITRRARRERGLVVSWGRHSGRGRGVVPCARQREVREDAVNDGGVVDGGDQLHICCANSDYFQTSGKVIRMARPLWRHVFIGGASPGPGTWASQPRRRL